jgi:hypothetical protein
MKKNIKLIFSKLLFLSIGVGATLVIYSVQALPHVPSSVGSGSTLSQSFWNQQVVTNINNMKSRVDTIATTKASVSSVNSKATGTHTHTISSAGVWHYTMTYANPIPPVTNATVTIIDTSSCSEMDECDFKCPGNTFLAGLDIKPNNKFLGHTIIGYYCVPIL